MTQLDPNKESSVLVRQASDPENKSDQNADDEVHSNNARPTITGTIKGSNDNDNSSTVEELKGPEAYIQARKNRMERRVIIDGRPYMPFLEVNVDQPETAATVVATMLGLPTSQVQGLDIVRVSGGNTNIIFCVSNLQTIHADATTNLPDKMLVRVFGGHGMIDRDIENATYAALSYANVAPPYWGRFGNGRLEGWFEELKTVAVQDMGHEHVSNAIATSVGQFHSQFILPKYLEKYHNPTQPSMWTQLQAWLQQALDSQFQTGLDTQRAQDLNLPQLAQELQWLQEHIVPSNAKVGFCHNDLLGANILVDKSSSCLEGKVKVQLIDFEYGGVNYLSFDLANHFNEFAGGTDGSAIPNYDWFPTQERQHEFVIHYLTAVSEAGKHPPSKQDIDSLLHEIHGFILANHLYWGLWAVNQAATEGCGDFDYLLYGGNRIRQYYVAKKEMEQ